MTSGDQGMKSSNDGCVDTFSTAGLILVREILRQVMNGRVQF